MSRRRVVDESVNHERWLVSYADFITLLFAFFVVMYSISQVNEGKYKVLSETLTDTFNSVDFEVAESRVMELPPERSLDPFQVGELAKSNPRNVIELNSNAIIDQGDNNEEQGVVDVEGGLPKEFEQLNNRIENAFGDLLDEKLVTVRGNEEWLEVELKSSLLFGSGDARLSPAALELLGGIAAILQGQGNPVRVEGFTDNMPINTVLFPSNWELSTARASAVVQLFIEEGLDPARFAAIGYGEHQPISDNDTDEGRAKNRRVVLMISKTGELRPALRELATAEQLLEQRQNTPENSEQAANQTGIEIRIPGVSPEPAAPAANENTDGNTGQALQGVRTIQLEDGGLLFTSEPEQ